MEDIINRGGGGTLKVQLYCSMDPRTLDESSNVPVSVDGRNYTVKAGTFGSMDIKPDFRINIAFTDFPMLQLIYSETGWLPD
jgi:D-lyxose ketol-isomerase